MGTSKIRWASPITSVNAVSDARMSPAEVLAANVVLSPAQVAVVLGLVVERGARKGEPDVRLVWDLVARGRLAPVDPSAPRPRWRFSRTLVERYIDDPTIVIVSTREQMAS